MTKFIAVLAVILASALASAKNLAENLGYGPNDRLLILHADDMGMISSENKASFDVLRKGPFTSASVMMPCAAVQEVLVGAVQDPTLDLGVHATLTSEWSRYHWGPVDDEDDVPSLTSGGHLLPSLLSFLFHARVDDVGVEIRAQIKKAADLGFKMTHIDTHMGSVFVSDEMYKTYLNAAFEAHLPPMAPRYSKELANRFVGKFGATILRPRIKRILDLAEKNGFWPLDDLIMGVEGKTFAERKAGYIKAIRGIKPGVTQIIVHVAYDDDDYTRKVLASDKRQIVRAIDTEIMLDPEITQVIREEGIHLIGWREISEKYPWSQVRMIQQ